MRNSRHFAQDLRLTRSFRSPAHQASVGLLRTAASLKNRIERIIKQHGISISQFNILRILRGAGKPLHTMEVAQRMVEVDPGITRLLVKLEKKNLVVRTRCASDARAVECSITDLGLMMLDRLDGPVAQVEEEVFAHLSKSDVAALNSILPRLHKRALGD